MSWRHTLSWVFMALAAVGGAMLFYLNIRYYILAEISFGGFVKAYWEPLGICFAWTLLCGAVAYWLGEDDRGYRPL